MLVFPVGIPQEEHCIPQAAAVLMEQRMSLTSAKNPLIVSSIVPVPQTRTWKSMTMWRRPNAPEDSTHEYLYFRKLALD